MQNFLSIGPTPLALDFTRDVNIIAGRNRDNGGRSGVG
jgi:hypothetical protein